MWIGDLHRHHALLHTEPFLFCQRASVGAEDLNIRGSRQALCFVHRQVIEGFGAGNVAIRAGFDPQPAVGRTGVFVPVLQGQGHRGRGRSVQLQKGFDGSAAVGACIVAARLIHQDGGIPGGVLRGLQHDGEGFEHGDFGKILRQFDISHRGRLGHREGHLDVVAVVIVADSFAGDVYQIIAHRKLLRGNSQG